MVLNKKILFIGAFFAATFAAAVLASSPFDIKFPIKELGDCPNKKECGVYCDIEGLEQQRLAAAVTRVAPAGEPTDNARTTPIASVDGFSVRIMKAGGGTYDVAVRREAGGTLTLMEWRNAAGTVISRWAPKGGVSFTNFFGAGFQRPDAFPLTVRMVVDDSERTLQVFFTQASLRSAGGGSKGAALERAEITTRQAACDAFSAKHGLGNAKERKEKLDKIERDGGPGGCARSENPYESCSLFCGQQANMRECLNYARENPEVMSGQDLREAEKVLAALESGVTLPAACTDMYSCEETCENPPTVDVAEQCFKFADQAGLIPEHVDPTQALKMFELMRSGEIPFKNPREFEKCDDPPDEATLQECFNIGLKLGMIPPEEVEMAKAFFAAGGPQKLGCKGKDCKDFCEKNEENRQKCGEVMAPIFEANPDLLPPEAREQMQEGMERMREAFEDAPPEVLDCLRESVGADFVDRVIAGGEIPFGEMMRQGRGLEFKMRGCFEQGFGGGPGGPGGEFPEEAKQCLVDVFGVSDISELKKPPTREEGDQLRACVEEMMGGPGGGEGVEGGFPGAPGSFPGGQGGGGFPSGGMSPAVQQCLTELGIRGAPTPEQQTQIGECVRDSMGGQEFDRLGPPGEFDEGESGEGHDGFVPPEGFEMPEGFQPGAGFPTDRPPSAEDIQKFQEQQRQQIESQYQQQQYQRQCVAAGGTWTGTKCQVPGGGFQYSPSPQAKFNPPSLLGFFAEILGLR